MLTAAVARAVTGEDRGGPRVLPGLRSSFRLPTLLLTLASMLCLTVTGEWRGSRFAARQHPPAYRLSSGRASVKVPFDLFENNILVRCRINNSPPLWLIFDTGASVNVLDERLVKELGLSTRGTSTLNAGGGAVTGAFVEGATLSLPGVEADQQLIAAVPLDPLPGYFGRDVRGIIGNNFISHFVVEIDYATRTLTFHDPNAYNLSGEPDAVEVENRGGIPFVKVEFSMNGRDPVTGWFEIDTGSNRIFDINRPFAETHKLLKALPKQRMVEGVGGAGVGGDTKYVEARISHLKLGRHIVTRPVASISQDAEGFGAGDAAGSIGSDLLRRFTVVLDYRSRRMLLKPNAHFKEPYEVDMSGLELVTRPDDFKVIQIKLVRAGFPAAEAGLRAGDIIVYIDGRPASELDLDKLVRMFKRVGKEYLLTVRRSDKVIRAKLKMRRAV